jgi:hypothetical protein
LHMGDDIYQYKEVRRKKNGEGKRGKERGRGDQRRPVRREM